MLGWVKMSYVRLGFKEKTVKAGGQQHGRQQSKTTDCTVAASLWPHSMIQLSNQVDISGGHVSRGRVKRQQKPNNAEGKCQEEATWFDRGSNQTRGKKLT